MINKNLSTARDWLESHLASNISASSWRGESRQYYLYAQSHIFLLFIQQSTRLLDSTFFASYSKWEIIHLWQWLCSVSSVNNKYRIIITTDDDIIRLACTVGKVRLVMRFVWADDKADDASWRISDNITNDSRSTVHYGKYRWCTTSNDYISVASNWWLH